MHRTRGFYWVWGLFFTLLVGCTPNSTPDRSDSNVLTLVKEISDLQTSVKTGRLMQSSSDRDKTEFSTILIEMKVALLRLSRDPFDNAALQALVQQIHELSRLQITTADQNRISNFVMRLKSMAYNLAQIQKLNLDNLSWKIYSYEFSHGLDPFLSYSNNGGSWASDWALEKSFAQASGQATKIWLISPAFDLQTIQSPALQIRHLLMINRNSKSTDSFDRLRIIREAFQVKVSTTFAGGDPEAHGGWTDLDVSPWPSSHDFHSVTSPEVSLIDHKSQTTTVAFVFDMKEKLGRHYVTWQIEEFALLGIGEPPVYTKQQTERRGQVLELNIRDASLSPFTTYSPLKNSAQWQYFNVGTLHAAKIQAKSQSSEAWLITPQIILNNIQDLRMKMRHHVNAPIWDKMRIKISSDFTGNNWSTATWSDLDYQPKPNQSGGQKRWQTIDSEDLDLQAYLGKSIVLAFQYMSDEKDFFGWEIESIRFYGLGQKLQTKPLEP